MSTAATATRWGLKSQQRIAKQFKWMVYDSHIHQTVSEFCNNWGINDTDLRGWCVRLLPCTEQEWHKMVHHNNRSPTFRYAKQRRKAREKL